jgi:hypothetical protein
VVHDVAYGPLWTTLCCTEGERGRRLITTTFRYQLCAIQLEIISTWKYMCQFYTEDNTSITAMCGKVESELYRLRIRKEGNKYSYWLVKERTRYVLLHLHRCVEMKHTHAHARAHTHTYFLMPCQSFVIRHPPFFSLLHNFHSLWFYIYFKMFASKVYNICFAVVLVFTSI